MIIRLILFFIILSLFIWGAYKLVLFLLGHRQNQPGNQHEPLVQCTHCQTFIPKSQAVKGLDCYYCSKEHADLHR